MISSDTEFETNATLETESSTLQDDIPFNLLLLGDWSGRKSRAVNSEFVDSKPIEIDKDNFEEVLRSLNVRLSLDFQGNGENILSFNFNELEDFHPDKIFHQIPFFAELRDVRRRLLNPETFNSAAREVRSWLVENEDEKKSELESQNFTMQGSESIPDNLLSQILGDIDLEEVNRPKSQLVEDSELRGLVKELVKPYLIRTDTTEQSKLLMIVDEIISDLMRNILHHPQFQNLESAWRGANFLIKRVESNRELKIYILDVNKNELATDLKNNSNLTDSRLYQILSRQIGNLDSGNSWAAVFGNFTFSLNVDDVAMLIRLSKIAADNNVPFISHTNPTIFGFESFAEINSSDNLELSDNSTIQKLWTLLRSAPEAQYLALALPRTLTRLPYGIDTEPTETFYFEEFTAVFRHQDYLWTNPIFVIALLLAQTFREYGWDVSQNFVSQVEGVPIHSYKDESENKIKPPAEILINSSNCEKILEQGLIPIISYKDDDKIRLGNFQSVAYPPTVIKGKWF